MDNIKISITGEGLSIEKMTSLHKAGQIISFLGLDSTKPVNMASGASTSVSLPLANKIQPKEMISRSSAKTYPQKITALGIYLKETQGQTSFSSDEVKAMLRKMGDEPKNFTRDLKSAVDLQYITCINPDQELYEVTDKGCDACDKNFAGSVEKKTAGTKRMFISNGVRDELKGMQIVATLDGLPGYHDLAKKADQILWLMQYADTKGINTITPVEVDFMSSELRGKIAAKHFSVLNDRNLKNGYVAKHPTGFQIQKKGSDYLMSLSSKATAD